MKNLSFILIFITSVSLGQTKKIFHKSHSGSSGTIFLDKKNSFGPGLGTLRCELPESTLIILYVYSKRNKYPIVELDTANRQMRFYGVSDSLLGLDRNYFNYLEHGDIVFDKITKGFWVYQQYENIGNNSKKLTHTCFKISDSLDAWESRPNYINNRNPYLRDVENKLVSINYPFLDIIVTSNLYGRMFEPRKTIPFKENKKVEKKKQKNPSKEKRKTKKQKRVQERLIKKDVKKDKEEIVFGISSSRFPRKNWFFCLGIFVFSFLTFFGLKQIMKEDIKKG